MPRRIAFVGWLADQRHPARRTIRPGLQQRNKLAEDRQQLSDDLSQLEKNLRNAARELAPTQPQASSKLRDALGGMDQTDLTNRVQRTADWLRRGINPNSNGTEEGISKGLDQLSQQVHQAQQGLGPGKPSQGQGEQTAALDHVERLRNQIESLTGRGQNPLGRQPGQQQGQGGQQQGQGWTATGTTGRTAGPAARSEWTVWSTSRELEQPRWPRHSNGSERRRESTRGKPGRSG